MSMERNVPDIGRRSFLKGAAAASAGMALASRMSVASAEEGEFDRFPRGVIHGDLPEGDLEDQFALAAECGFEGIESNTVDSVDEAKRMADVAQEAGIELHSIMFGGWDSPLSHPDEDVARQGREELEHCIETA
ncbi:MAG: twin-arginine translocation signal domain-containing protein, partial [Candidatus Hydrogenedentota bacterium]